jgi:hypothetical protein
MMPVHDPRTDLGREPTPQRSIFTGQQFHDMRDAPTATFAEKPNWVPRIQRRSRKTGYPDFLYITGADCICGTLDT